MPEQIFDELGRFILKDYDRRKPFSSFLPGIAGLGGIPLWVFYVNRGQGIASFGIESKDSPIMEFQPANVAYRQNSLTGFRTFIKIDDGVKTNLHEPFAESEQQNLSRNMYIGMDTFEIEEIHLAFGLKVNVHYSTIPNEDFAALVRKLRIENLTGQRLRLEVMDGMPVIVPFGVNDFLLKHLGRTIEAWMEVYQLEEGTPFYKVRASLEDSAEVKEISGGNFALAYQHLLNGLQPLRPIVDPKVIFGQNLSFTRPVEFQDSALKDLFSRSQKTLGQTPCAFFGGTVDLGPLEAVEFSSLFGHVDHLDKLAIVQARISPEYLNQKLDQTRRISGEITAPIDGKTAQPIFDAYARQTFLDNVLRGGKPLILPGGSVYHIFSRKHGDPERDYNYFYLAPEFYSQGNGSYRDVNQNRRNDVLFYPLVEDYNLRFFLSLIQLDGYNPLVIKGAKYVMDRDGIKVVVSAGNFDGLSEFLAKPFTPGSLLQFLRGQLQNDSTVNHDSFSLVLSNAEQVIDAEHGEGFWVDHWTYNLDLIDSYLSIYPDKQHEMLFSSRDLPWFDNFARVQPRSRRYRWTPNGLRQYNAVIEDEEYQEVLRQRGALQSWVRSPESQGQVYRSSVFEKLFILLVLKAAALDPAGMGIEMEAGKPGWYDALNGLPGIFGSSVSETYEAVRLAGFLLKAIDDEDGEQEIRLPVEFADFLTALLPVLPDEGPNASETWRRISGFREAYRTRVYAGISGKEIKYRVSQMRTDLQLIANYLEQAVDRAGLSCSGLPPTYFYYQADAPESGGDQAGDSEHPDPGSLIFKQHSLPDFLEGCVHALRISGRTQAERIYESVRGSDLFDSKLGMYKVNAALSGVTQEVGRTISFPPGWLENESVWLHMEYKYLLEVLRSGLYDEFYQDIQTALVPFLSSETYGRSLLENSSFIASSAYPDASVHGAGFVARLSGATAEFLTVWFEMFAGRDPFSLQDKQLVLEFRPKLAEWMFPSSGVVEFTFLGHTRVKYFNPGRVDTWLTKTKSSRLIYQDGNRVQFDTGVIPSPHALDVREGLVAEIQIELGEV
jgi:hypothetical protein